MGGLRNLTKAELAIIKREVSETELRRLRANGWSDWNLFAMLSQAGRTGPNASELAQGTGKRETSNLH